jgi:DsbC/DsbD-like thiol-disulfide interchange protein
MITRLSLLFAILMMALSAQPAQAQSDANPFGDMVQIRILPGWRAADHSHMAGIEIRLAPGWKTYWRAPGDAGIPPLFDWAGSTNLSGVEVSWPTPEVFRQSGMRTLGYENRVVLPITVAPRRNTKPVRLTGTVNLGICRDVCVPVQVEIGETLNTGPASRDPTIAAALADQPFSAAEAGLTALACNVAPAKDGLSLTAEFTLPSTGGREMAVVEINDPMIWASEPRISRKGGRLRAEFDLMHASGGSFALDRSALRFTIIGRNHAVDIRGCNG